MLLSEHIHGIAKKNALHLSGHLSLMVASLWQGEEDLAVLGLGVLLTDVGPGHQL